MRSVASLSVPRRSPAAPRLYRVELIHRINDWDASLTFPAPDARTARKWAPVKLAQPDFWLITSAKLVKPTGSAA